MVLYIEKLNVNERLYYVIHFITYIYIYKGKGRQVLHMSPLYKQNTLLLFSSAKGLQSGPVYV